MRINQLISRLVLYRANLLILSEKLDNVVNPKPERCSNCLYCFSEVNGF